MTHYYHYTIPGTAVPQGRPRLTTIGGHPRAYDPKKSRDYKTFVQHCVKEQGAPGEPLSIALNVIITEFRAIPKSWSIRKHREAICGHIRPTTRPDVDNVAKAIFDALNGLVWDDDSQIVHATTEKYYSDDPKVVIGVSSDD